MSYTTLVKRIKTPGANPDVDYDNGGQEWVSVQAYLDYMDGEGAEIPLKKTLVITPQNGQRYEVWNPVSARTFVPKVMGHSHSYDDLQNKPAIPVVNDSEIVFTHDGKEVGRMTTNQSAGKTIEVGEGEERVFTAAFLKKVLTCRMNKEVYMTSKDVVAPNMLKFNAFAEPGSSSTAWCGAGTEPTASASTRIMIHNVNVSAWKGRTFTFSIMDGYQFAIASGTVNQQTGVWEHPYPRQSDVPWNWHTSSDPVTVTLGDMVSIMIKNNANNTINWAYFYVTMWDLLAIEETQDSRKNPPRQLKDGRYAGYRVGVLGDSILAGASTMAYMTALDVLVADYGIVPVPRCIAGSCIAPTSLAYSRDGIRFKNRIEINWQTTAGGYNGIENGVNREKDPFLGVLIYCVNDVLMDKEKLDTEAFPLAPDAVTGVMEYNLDTSALASDGYLAALLDLETTIQTGSGSILNHIYLVGPYRCRWPGNYMMTTTGINPNGDSGEDFVDVQQKFCMCKGWSYLNLLSSQLNTFLPGMSNDKLHPSQEGHQLLGDLLGQMLCGTILTQADRVFGGEKNPLKGKKWTVLGDSLTAATSYTTKPYHAYIAEQMGVNVVNLGVGGTGYLAGYNDLENFALKVADIPADTDFVTVFGSFNDIASLDLEEYEAGIGTISSTGYTTICGAINEFFDELYTRFPACKIGVILPTPWKTMTPMYTDAPAHDYVDKLKTICERKGVPYLDLFHQSGLRPWDSANRLAMYSKDLDSGQTDPRGTHPNEAGHYVIASKIREFIKSLI